jgi:hypothetical protein
VSTFPGSNAESTVARHEAEVGPPGRGVPPRPGAGPTLPGPARALFQAAGLVAALGALAALAVPVLGLSSTSCGPLNCGLVQTLGKVMAAGGIGVALATVAVQSLRTRQFSAAVLAALVAGPALLWAVMIVDQWRQLDAGTDEASAVIAIAREYAAGRGLGPAGELRPLIYNGRGDWISVKITAPNGASAFVLERRDGGGWAPVAMAPTFTRDDLRALGAPTDLLRDPG